MVKKGKLILFGSGKNGIKALHEYGKNKVIFFADNNKKLHGTYIEGKKVISFEEMLSYHKEGYLIMITPVRHASLVGQLELAGIKDYLLYKEKSNDFFEEWDKNEKLNECHNKQVEKYIEQSIEQDCIKDITELKNIVNDICMQDIPLCLFKYHDESMYYGNLHTLAHYIGKKTEDMKYFPIITHYSTNYDYGALFRYKSAVITMGERYKKDVHRYFPYLPVFNIGPYIQYVEPYYKQEEYLEYKKEIGKMVVFFLPHGNQGIVRNYNGKKYIDMLIKMYKNSFDSIWMCVYWADVNNEVCEYAENAGIHIVSAGLRPDKNFSRRLKTIIQLSDEIVSADLGTQILYALQMNKKITMVEEAYYQESYETEIENILTNTTENHLYENQLMELFKNSNSTLEERKDFLEERIGYSKIRSKDYIKAIYEISKDVWKTCNGRIEYYPEAVRICYRKYEINRNFYFMSILKEATEGYVN